MASSSQKFIARNRSPRVQIEYDVELYGSKKKIQIPFIMGVMADLSGKPAEPLAPVADRKFLEIDVDNFDDRLKSMKPRTAFVVPNTLTGEGNMSVDITFESMDDFTPEAVAKKVGALNNLLEARNQLKDLLSYMDGKVGAEELLGKVLERSRVAEVAGGRPEAGRRRRPPPDANRRPRTGRIKPCRPNKSPLNPPAPPPNSTISPRCCRRSSSRRPIMPRRRSRRAVFTLAQQALADTKLISQRCLQDDRRNDRGDRQEADRAGQPDHAPRRTSPSSKVPGAVCITWSTTPRPTRP